MTEKKKEEAKPLTDKEKVAALIELAESNGWTLPKGLKDPE